MNSGALDRPSVTPWSFIPILCIVIGFLSIIPILFLVSYFKKKNNAKAIEVIIFLYGLTFLGLEIYHEINRFITLGFYDWSSFPFQFCSMPIYLCPLIIFIKNQKIKDTIYYYLGTYCLVSGIFPLFFGQSQLCRWTNVFDTVRSFIWHIMIIHVAILSIFYKKMGENYKSDMKTFVNSIGLFLSFTIIAQLINVTLHYSAGVNFATSDGNIIKDTTNTYLYDPDIASCFYISPFFVSNMPVYESIYRTCGWIVNYIAYIFSFSLMSFILFNVYYLINKTMYMFKLKK